MVVFKRLTGLLIGWALLGVGPVLACSCPPASSAEAQAENYDFVGIVTVGEVMTLQSKAQIEETEASSKFNNDYSDMLLDYIERGDAGEDLAPFEEFERAFYANATYRPPPYAIPAERLTQMKVSRVLKGESATLVFVRSSDPGMPACGVVYKPETELLLLAKGEDGLYRTWICDRAQFSVEEFADALNNE